MGFWEKLAKLFHSSYRQSRNIANQMDIEPEGYDSGSIDGAYDDISDGIYDEYSEADIEDAMDEMEFDRDAGYDYEDEAIEDFEDEDMW